MKLCLPVTEDNGLESKMSAHFGSAPIFLLYESRSDALQVIPNTNQHHSHGMCHPISVLAAHKPEAVICNGMGRGAINQLNSSGIKAYACHGKTAREVLEDFKNGKLSELTPEMACAHHGCH